MSRPIDQKTFVHSDTHETSDPQRICLECAKILASVPFRRSRQMARLLTYLVDFSVSNPEQSPKAYAIAVDVLGRSPDFDPASDSTPRVAVGRLRHMLDHYYVEHFQIRRLAIPVGSYHVVIEEHDRRGGDDGADADIPKPHPHASTPEHNESSALPKRGANSNWRVLIALLVGVAIGALIMVLDNLSVVIETR